MAITVRIYKNYKKRSNSTKVPANVEYTDLTCTLKDNCSITAPVMDVLSIQQNPAALGYNYAYIPSFNRYYYINDWTYSTGVWTFSASVDVLTSFKTEIGNLTKYVTRAQASYDQNIIDTAYPTKAEESVSYVTAASPFTIADNGSYIVGIVGKQQTGVPCIGGINYYLFTQSQMAQFISYLLSDTFATLLSDDAAGFTSDVVKSIASPTDYIMSCMWFPFIITGATAAPKVQPKIGFWDSIAPITGGLTPLMVANPSITNMEHLVFNVPITETTLTIPAHPQAAMRGNYLNTSPYSNYIFHLEPWGDIPINGSRILNTTRQIVYSIYCEALTGMATLELYNSGNLLTRQIAQVGVPMSIAQIINDLSKLGTGQVAAGAIAGAASRLQDAQLSTSYVNVSTPGTDILGESRAMVPVYNISGGGASLLASVGKSMISGISAAIADIDSRGVNGSVISYVGAAAAKGPYIKISRYNLVAEDINEMGRPLMAMQLLSSIPGYIECSDGHHNINCMTAERSAIAAYLTGGFIYE